MKTMIQKKKRRRISKHIKADQRRKKNKKTGKEKKPKSLFQQQLLELEQNQLQSFVFKEQRKAEMTEREKDREFTLQPWKIFAQKQD